MNNSIINLPVESLNYHLWEPCNMRCKFCFATFQDVKSTILPKGHLCKKDALKLMHLICKTNAEKVTLAGGEPTLCPWLFDLLEIAKSYHKTTMIVTNGTSISKKWLLKYSKVLDWINLSIDSVNELTNLKSGRAITGKKIISKDEYLKKINQIREIGIRLKINTVVNALNKNENLSSFIELAKPERWKILQVLPIKNQNDNHINNLLISKADFKAFIEYNLTNSAIKVIVEFNNDMTNSYLMIDPAGRFYQNTNGMYNYSKPILNVGIIKALKGTEISTDKYNERGAKYNW